MTIAYACAISHAPGFTAWTDAAPAAQRDALYAGTDRLREGLAAAKPDALVMFTSEHWTNFFLDHIGPVCIGRGESFHGPVEPWLKIDKREVPGAPALAEAILAAAYAQGVEPSFAHEMLFDHGTMIPLNFLTPAMDVPVVPVLFNTLAPPQMRPHRAFELGRIIGEVARASGLRIALVATGGMSHDPGEVGHGRIDEAFDRNFLQEMATADLPALAGHSIAGLAAAGAGAIELIAWIALAGAMRSFTGEIIAYEPVVPWATGMGLMQFDVAA